GIISGENPFAHGSEEPDDPFAYRVELRGRRHQHRTGCQVVPPARFQLRRLIESGREDSRCLIGPGGAATFETSGHRRCRVSPSNSNESESAQMSWKSFIRLLSVSSLTIASNFSATVASRG